MANPLYGTDTFATVLFAESSTTTATSDTITQEYTATGFSAETNKEVGLKYHIAIDTIGYMLASYDDSVRKKISQPSFVDTQAQGDRTDNDIDSFWWHEFFTEFRQGQGQKHLDSKERYWTSAGIDISTDGEFKLLKETTLVQGVNSSYYTVNIPAKVIGSYIYVGNVNRGTGGDTAKRKSSYSSNGTDFTEVSTVAAADIVDFETDGTNVYGAHSLGVAKGAIGTTADWTAVWSNPDSGGAAATKLLYHNLGLYGIKSSVLSMYTLATGAATTKYTATGYTLTDMDGGESGNVYFCGYAGNQGTVFQYDGTNATVLASLPTGFIPTCLTYYLTGIYVGGYYLEASSGGKAAVYAIQADGSMSKLAILDKIDTTAGVQHAVRSIAGVGDKLYIGADCLTGLYVYNLANGGLSKNVYTSLTVGTTYKVLDVCWFLNKPFFTVGINNALGGLYSEATTYMPTGNLTTSVATFNTTNPKLIGAIFVSHTALAAGQSVNVEFTTDESTTWTTATVPANTTETSTETVVEFNGLTAKRISVRVTLTAGTTGLALADTTETTLKGSGFSSGMVGSVVYNSTDATWTRVSAFVDSATLTLSGSIFAVGETYVIAGSSTPTVYDIKIRAVPVLNNLYSWELPILANSKQPLITGSLNEKTPDEIVGTLRAIKEDNTVVCFQDIWWDITGEIHYVIIEDIQEITKKLQPRKELESIVMVKLREVKESSV